MHKSRNASRQTLTVMLFIFLPFGFIACPGGSSQNNNTGAQSSPAAKASPSTIVFDEARAFEHVRKQVEIGPRPAGSAELAKTREYITGELKSYGLSVFEDEFHPGTHEGEKKMVNVVAELAGESSDIIIISSHYDTKRHADFRFVGANDGASSTAVVMEMARSLAVKGKPRLTYRFVFFDGEEALCEDWNECGKPGQPDNTYGSRHYVDLLKQKNELSRVRALILLDMVGYKNLQIPREATSSAWINDIIWQTAREIGYGAQFVEHTDSVEDDHVPFLRAGVEAVDLIQLGGYPYWHTAEDTLDKISPKSLKAVGETVLASLPRIEQRIQSRKQ